MLNKNEFHALETYKHSFIKNASMFIGLLVVATAILRSTLSGFASERLIVPLIVGVVFILISIHSRFKGYVKYHAYLILIGASLIAFNGGIQNGGMRAPVVAGVFIIPLIGVILLGKKGGIFGLILNVLVFLILFFLDKLNLIKPYDGTHSNVFFPIIYFSISLITFTIVWALQKAKQESDELINKMYNEIILKAQISSLVKLSEGMSHEINNPLAIIAIKTQKIKEILKKNPVNNDEISKAILDLEKIQVSTERITKVVAALFQFSHNSENVSAEKLNLSELINLSLEAVAFRGAAKQIKFVVICSKEIELLAKKGQLSQVIVNLINNAIDALDNVIEKSVEINVTKDESKIYISVTDSGPGIPKEFQDKVLLPFFTTKEIGKGSGMGLSISLGIIQSMGGDLWLDKNCSHAKFVIELPILF